MSCFSSFPVSKLIFSIGWTGFARLPAEAAKMRLRTDKVFLGFKPREAIDATDLYARLIISLLF